MPNRNIAIRTEQLAAGFGDRVLFRDLDLRIAEGAFVLIRGENGTGKTTLIRILLGLQAPAAGRVFILGRRQGTRDWRAVRRQVAYVSQHATSSDFPVTAREVAAIGTAGLRLSPADKKTAVREAMCRADCLHLADAPYVVLSGGEKQRVSLARCLAQHARIFLLDEPASHLDRRSKAELMEILRRCNRDQGITVVLVSHEHHDSPEGTDGILRVTLHDGAAGNARTSPVDPHIHGEADW